MKNLTTAIYGRLSGSSFSTAIGGRMYKSQAPENTEFPYAVYRVVTNTPERTFSEDYENTTIQFSLFSIASGTTEIENMFTTLKALYDEFPFTVSGGTLVWMRRYTTIFNVEDHTTATGTQRVWTYHVDFDVKVSLS